MQSQIVTRISLAFQLLRNGPPGWDIVREVVRLPSPYSVCVAVRGCVYSVSRVL